MKPSWVAATLAKTLASREPPRNITRSTLLLRNVTAAWVSPSKRLPVSVVSTHETDGVTPASLSSGTASFSIASRLSGESAATRPTLFSPLKKSCSPSTLMKERTNAWYSGKLAVQRYGDWSSR